MHFPLMILTVAHCSCNNLAHLTVFVDLISINKTEQILKEFLSYSRVGHVDAQETAQF